MNTKPQPLAGVLCWYATGYVFPDYSFSLNTRCRSIFRIRLSSFGP